MSVFVMAQTIEPFLFHLFIQRRVDKGYAPMTLWGVVKTVIAFLYFVFGSFVLTLLGFILIKLIPLSRKRMRLVYHTLISVFTRSLVYVMANVKKQVIGAKGRFDSASVIVCNHQSFLDILVTTMLHPRIILLTNRWVWNSPVFGGVVRLADYYPVMEGADQSVEQLRQRVSEGYSVLVFPEGTRSPDGRMRRFHKGAFFIAEKLNLPIQPLMLHGTGDTIRKGEFYINDATMTLKFLPRIMPGDMSMGTTYAERAKYVGRYFRQAFEEFDRESRTPKGNRYKVIANFLYKGPVLEWYMRVKMSLEKNYEPFHALIPHNARVLDLGCGYGFLCYMLFYLSDQRVIKGVDYDEDKVNTALHGFGRTQRLTFEAADVTTLAIEDNYDAIVIADVLHYLTPAQQEAVLTNACRAVKPGGKVIVREGNKDEKERHKGTQLSELFSVKILRFNKSVHELHFMSGGAIEQIAHRLGLSVRKIDDTKFTSNVIFVVEKPTAS
ncbi:MAG: methyltransferase domain-containing protein [Bacteroidia bacterium]|nr:methyltransferase domain-containing protein [Bacteroidia bacterium]